ncbi:MAG: MerR family transcriptional regulator [Prevotella sp.]|jgi:DNA-binding transcriptional MerR regulator|nr:MerR family transcriptional regulator [Prevotella sp.]MEE1120089.1 MerR family transcriptional regulator [Prevotella sp.]
MTLKQNKNLKLYYSIKEVAQMFNVSESLLRYWETEFPTLRPKTTPNKVRQYSEADIKQVRNIHNLLKVRGFKIAAARKMINKNPTTVDKSADILNTLISVRDELKDLKKQLDSLQ